LDFIACEDDKHARRPVVAEMFSILWEFEAIDRIRSDDLPSLA
jgi:hypothetical protein